MTGRAEIYFSANLLFSLSSLLYLSYEEKNETVEIGSFKNERRLFIVYILFFRLSLRTVEL